MSEWVLYFHYGTGRYRDEWNLWLRGTLEEVMADALGQWPHDVDAIRIERTRDG